MSTEPVIVKVPGVPANSLMFRPPEIGPKGVVLDPGVPAVVIDPKTGERRPTFTTSEVSKTFFGFSGHWLRWREGEGATELDGKLIVPERSNTHIRQYTLADIELTAHALAQNGAIKLPRLVRALRVIRDIGRLWELLPDPEID